MLTLQLPELNIYTTWLFILIYIYLLFPMAICKREQYQVALTWDISPRDFQELDTDYCLE